MIYKDKQDFWNMQDAALVVGSVRGKRCWRIAYGRLVSPVMDHEWCSGENVAVHQDWPEDVIRAALSREDALRFAAYVKTIPAEEHIPRCGCGFYGFFADEKQEYAKYGVEGVIEGYGEATIGTRGFRCRKAKILAIAPSQGWWKRTFSIGVPGLVEKFDAAVLQKMYPDVKVYRSKGEMYRDFPVSKAEDFE